MLVIHVNWMLILYFFVGAVVVVSFKFIVNYYFLNGGVTTTYQHRMPPERWSISIDIDELPPQFEDALKFSKPVYRIEIDEPPPPYHLVIINDKSVSS